MDLTLGEVDLGPHLWRSGTWNSWRGGQGTSLLERWTLDLTLGEEDLGPYSWRVGPWTSILES